MSSHFQVLNYNVLTYRLHLIFPIAKLESQQLMTTQIRSRIEYLITADNVLLPF